MTATIQWYSIDADGLPDEGLLVLIANAQANEPVWIGYIEDGEWYLADGARAYPTHWSEMPEGPQP
jgi:hypothetical protein